MKKLQLFGIALLMGAMFAACEEEPVQPVDPADTTSEEPVNPPVTGEGTTTVTWDGVQWQASAVYCVVKDASGVTLEVYKDPSDNQAPYMVVKFPVATGTYYASQTDMTFMCLWYDYPGQTGTYYGQQIPPYQPAQGMYMTISAIDGENGVFSGELEGEFVNIDEYQSGGNYQLHSLSVVFSTTQWTDVTK